MSVFQKKLFCERQNNCLLFFVCKRIFYQNYHLFSTVIEEVKRPCAPNPCGANAECIEKSGAGACKCLPEYFGDPYSGCRPECILNTDCPSHFACLNNKCKDPCPGVCALNTECRVSNHVPTCHCKIGYVGNPFTGCHIEEQPPPSKKSSKRFFEFSLERDFIIF